MRTMKKHKRRHLPVINPDKTEPPMQTVPSSYRDIKLGDTVCVVFTTLIKTEDVPGPKSPEDKLSAKVVYIHPQRRFFTAEVTMSKGVIRECFPIPQT